MLAIVVKVTPIIEDGKWKFPYKKLVREVYEVSLADALGLRYIIIDLSEAQEILWAQMTLRDDGPSIEPALRELIQRLINGVEIDGEIWRVSGTAQSTKTGKLYAYTNGFDWRDAGFLTIGDAIRGGAVHPAAGAFPPMSMEVNAIVLDKAPDYGEEGPAVGDGQMAASPDVIKALTGRENIVVQVRALGNRYLLKGTLRPDPSLPPRTIAVLAADVKGDNKAELNEPGLHKLTWAGLAVAEKTTKKIGHQTLVWATLYGAFVAALKKEWPQLVEEYNRLWGNKDRLKFMARFADQPIFKDGHIDLMALLGHAAKLCLAVGNDMLMRSKGIVDLVQQMAASWADHVALGKMEAILLMAQNMACVKPYEVWLNPRDLVRRNKKTGKLEMPVILAPDENGRLVWRPIKGGDTIRVGRMPDTCGGVRVFIRISEKVDRGCAWTDAHTLAVTGLDFDGDRVYIVLPMSERERAFVDMPNPEAKADKVRANGAIPESLAEAIMINLEMIVGLPFDLIQRALVLKHKALRGKLPPAKAAAAIKYVDSILPVLEWQGQIGVDNAKRFGRHDMELLMGIAKKLYELGLEPADMVWLEYARGNLRPWLPIAKSRTYKFGGKFADMVSEMKPNEILLPKVEKGISPIGDMYAQAGEDLKLVQDTALDNAYFQNILPLPRNKEILDKAVAFLKYLNKKMLETSNILDEEEREEAGMAIVRYMREQANRLRTSPEKTVEFLLALWHVSFSGEQSQKVLWRFMPDELFAILWHYRHAFKTSPDAKPWEGVVYGKGADQLPLTVYDAVLGEHVQGGKSRQKFTLTGQASGFVLLGDNQPPYQGPAKFKARLKKSASGKLLLVAIVAAAGNSVDEETPPEELLAKAGYSHVLSESDKAVMYGDFVKKVNGDWFELRATSQEALKWVLVHEHRIREIAMARINAAKLAEEMQKTVANSFEALLREADEAVAAFIASGGT